MSIQESTALVYHLSCDRCQRNIGFFVTKAELLTKIKEDGWTNTQKFVDTLLTEEWVCEVCILIQEPEIEDPTIELTLEDIEVVEEK